MTQLELTAEEITAIETIETIEVKPETKTARLKREAKERSEAKMAAKAEELKLEAERVIVREQETKRFQAHYGWVDYPANKNKQSA